MLKLNKTNVLRTLGAIVGAALLSLGAGCDSEPGAAIGEVTKGPPPLHPAMSAKARPPVAAKRDPHAGLPGHGSQGAPSAGAARGGSPGLSNPGLSNPGAGSSGGGTPTDLKATLARFELDVVVPEAWPLVPSTSRMRLATLKLPRVDGDEVDGEMSVIQLPGGGSIDANIRRWEGQFREKPQAKTRRLQTDGGIALTLVEMEGTFSPGGPMSQGKGAAAGTLLLGSIVELPHHGGLLFFKGWGPKATMERWRGEFETFMESLKHRAH